MKIAVVVITKNGRAHLPASFESVVGFADKAIVLDTGSTDGTQEWLRTQKILPVELHEAPFVDFASSRNVAMRHAKGKADWLIPLDDDWTVHFTAPKQNFRDFLQTCDKDYFVLRLRSNGIMAYGAYLLRGDKDWIYKGRVHERLHLGDSLDSLNLFNGILVQHEDYNFRRTEKLELYAKLLKEELEEKPNDPGLLFFLASTLRELGKLEEALPIYIQRLNMGGYAEIVWICMFEIAQLTQDPNNMLKAFHARPSRAESAKWLSLYYQAEGDREAAQNWERIRAQIPFPSDLLFVNESCYGA